jgi:hypothetical protein
MAKATTTIRQTLNYQPQHAQSFAAHQALFNRVVAFYFEVIAAHEKVLDLSTKEALTALEKLTHATQANPTPIMPLSEVAQDVPAMFRRAAINAAIGLARSFCAHLRKWRTRKEKASAKGMKFTGRPPVPPRSWNKSAPFYAGQWKQRSGSSILLKVWTGSRWSWIKVHTLGRDVPAAAREGGEIHRCCSLPGSQKQRRAIYSSSKAWRAQRAWHRPGKEASDGNAPLSYPSPTTPSIRVGATLHVSGRRLHRSGRSRWVLTLAECHKRFPALLCIVQRSEMYGGNQDDEHNRPLGHRQ